MADLIIRVEGMSCGHCTAQVKKTLESLAAGLQAEPDLESGQVRLRGGELPGEEELQAAILRAGFRFGGRVDA